jgi:beta-xylosidase
MKNLLKSVIFFCCIGACQRQESVPLLDLADIRIRDPFVLADASTQTYYMYAQMDNRLTRDSDEKGVEVYKSADLKSWHGPTPVLILPDSSWAKNMVWAPEVHEYFGKYYLFVTLTSHDTLPDVPGRPKQLKRGTQIFYSDSPDGPFKAFANKPHTPINWMALDGTLWVEDYQPWMIFCHEWWQVTDGTMELVKLKKDLSDVDGELMTIFTAHAAPWVKAVGGESPGYVTDGPFLYKTKDDHLLMIWSSFGENGYAIAVAESASGEVTGPWFQHNDLLFAENGGHGMIFTSFDGRLMLVFHQPNKSPEERAQFYEINDLGTRLELKKNTQSDS